MTSTPHDALFKTIFGQPDHAAAELQHVLPEHLCERIDWSSLELEPGSYVDEALADQHSDLLFSARARASGEPVLVYLLFEHQSTPEPHMALRLLGYMVRVWTRHAQTHPGAPLPLIIPVVLAQTPGGWTAATRFADLFSPRIASWAPGVLPDFEYAVDDLHRANDLRTRNIQDAARLALWLLRDARDRDALLAHLPPWADTLESLAHTTAGKGLLAILLRYIALVSRDLHLTEFRAILRGRAPTAEAVTMTIAEQLRAEGKAEGLAQGETRGKADAIIVLLRGRNIHVPADVQQHIEACADADTLNHWLVRAASVSDAADIFEG